LFYGIGKQKNGLLQKSFSPHDCMDAGGRVTHGAVTERRKERRENKFILKTHEYYNGASPVAQSISTTA
jgi:hypothetical protein